MLRSAFTGWLLHLQAVGSFSRDFWTKSVEWATVCSLLHKVQVDMGGQPSWEVWVMDLLFGGGSCQALSRNMVPTPESHHSVSPRVSDQSSLRKAHRKCRLSAASRSLGRVRAQWVWGTNRMGPVGLLLEDGCLWHTEGKNGPHFRAT